MVKDFIAALRLGYSTAVRHFHLKRWLRKRRESITTVFD